MSESFLDLESWPEGIAAARIPANNNVRSEEAFRGPAISATTAAQPGSPAERDIYILPASPTGAQWGSFFEGDVVIYYESTWTAFEPFDGLRKFVLDQGEDWQFVGDSSGGWTPVGSGGGIVNSVVAGTNITVDNTDPANPIVSASGGAGSPGGADKQVQYNDAGAFGGEAGFEYDESTNTLTVPNETLSGLLNEAKGSDIASAGTTDIAAATANFVHITGTTTITALGTAQAGAQRILVFDGALTFTHNGTSLILPTGANITTVAGDTAFMVSEGSGNWRCVAYLRKDGSALLGGGGGLTNWTEAVNTTAPNGTIPVVSFTATNAATNVDGAVLPKGTGAFLLQIPDNTTAGGNKRGIRSVDLQRTRSNANQVADGQDAFAAGANNRADGQTGTAIGSGNRAGGISSTAIGGSNSATAAAATAIGNANTASAAAATALGNGNTASAADATALGNGCVANGAQGVAEGYRASNRSVSSRAFAAGGFFSAVGDGQLREFVLLANTTNATPKAMSTTAAAAASTNTVVLPNNACYEVSGMCIGRQTTGDVAAFQFNATIKRGANAAATALVGAAVVTSRSDAGASTWTLGVTADTTIGGLALTVTGEAAKTIAWVATVECCEYSTS